MIWHSAKYIFTVSAPRIQVDVLFVKVFVVGFCELQLDIVPPEWEGGPRGHLQLLSTTKDVTQSKG